MAASFRFLLIALALLCSTSVMSAQEGPLMPGKWPAGVKVTPADTTNTSIEVAGGWPSDHRQVVGLRFYQKGQLSACSGLLVSKKIVLTAAHCTCGDHSFDVTNGPFNEEHWVHGTFVSRFGNYDCNVYPPKGDDLALIKIDKETNLFLNSAKEPICGSYGLLSGIKRAGDFYPNFPRRVTVAGYGFEGDDESSIGLQRETIVDVNSFACADPIASHFMCKPFKEFVAGAVRTDGMVRDTCAGDSGGPAFAVVDGSLIPVGIVSRALPVQQLFPRHGDCGSGGIYTLIGRIDVLDWMRKAGVSEGDTDQSCAPPVLQ
ncbi:MAG: trypsin-like serine protease [Mesorhizobium sp.]